METTKWLILDIARLYINMLNVFADIASYQDVVHEMVSGHI